MRHPHPPADRPLRIAVIGEAMIELSPLGPDSARIRVAGDIFNTAVYLSRLLGGTDTRITCVTALGDDRQSDRILTAMHAEGIDTRLVERLPGATPGLYMIELDEKGERSFSYWRTTSAARRLFTAQTRLRPEDMQGFDLVFLSAITLAILDPGARDALYHWARDFRSADGLIAFDSNYRPRLWPDLAIARQEVSRFWSITDIALPSLDDEVALFGDADQDAVMARLAASGVAYGALKRGLDGPIALDASRQELGVDPASDVLDTTGAGDSFNAGFLASWAEGADIARAMAGGHALALRVIRHRGAILPVDAAHPGAAPSNTTKQVSGAQGIDPGR